MSQQYETRSDRRDQHELQTDPTLEIEVKTRRTSGTNASPGGQKRSGADVRPGDVGVKTKSVTDCPMCGEPLPSDRDLYCTTRCRERAKKQRQRARAGGADVVAPAARRRHDVTAELADHLASKRGARADVVRDELAAAQRETARLSAELAAQRREAAKARQALGRERSARQSVEREVRFVSVAFARTMAAHGLADRVPEGVRGRVSAWLPEGENPWR